MVRQSLTLHEILRIKALLHVENRDNFKDPQKMVFSRLIMNGVPPIVTVCFITFKYSSNTMGQLLTSLNPKAFGNVVCNSDPNNRSYRSFFQFNNGKLIYKDVEA